MKRIYSTILMIAVLFATSCKKDLLTQVDNGNLVSSGFYERVEDATLAVYGVYQATRIFYYKTYAWDGGSEMMHSRINNRPYSSYTPGGSMGSSMAKHWNDGYRSINRANSLIVNVRNMIAKETIQANLTVLKRVEAEALFLRAITYFRLIDLWGDVPYYENILDGNNEAYSLVRTPKAIIKDNIIRDLELAAASVPITIPAAERGRVPRAAVYAYLGKIKLYWASWMKRDGNPSEADTYFRAAAVDLKEVMDAKYGLALYKGGDAGPAEAPFYGELFNGEHEDNPEIVFAFQNGGPALGTAGIPDVFWGDTYLYDFGTRSTGAGGVNVAPTPTLVNRYQLISTGDFAAPLTPSTNRTGVNSAINPASYAGRDYRLKATVMWDGQTINEVLANGVVTANVLTFEYKTNAPTPPYIFADGAVTGYLYRKYIRQIGAYPREDGPQDQYMIRLPDVWLMYAEAVNEYEGPNGETIGYVNRIRARGGLPALGVQNTASPAAFFNAIEQERIVEFAAEGCRFFDIRRWGKVEQIFGGTTGLVHLDTRGQQFRQDFVNANEILYQRFYLFQIPTVEILNNPGIKQNEPWL